MTHKTIYLQTNYNNKLNCQSFIHIDAAPKSKVPYSKMDDTLIEIRTNDNSYPPITAMLEDMLIIPLKNIICLETWPSHGMRSWEFAKWLMEQKPDVTLDSQLGIYYYKKIEKPLLT